MFYLHQFKGSKLLFNSKICRLTENKKIQILQNLKFEIFGRKTNHLTRVLYQKDLSDDIFEIDQTADQDDEVVSQTYEH
jgi:hypothetical protein